jgi:general secretion pathway protein A
MYERHFGFEENPFGMTPDPRFFFRSSSHREAFAALDYGIRNRRGFMTLVGEVGTGKTILLNALLESLDRSTCIIQVRHTTVDREDLLRLILNNLYATYGEYRGNERDEGSGLFAESRAAGLSRAELISEFNAFVTGEFLAYQPAPVLVIDEAQNLARDVLEEIRLLTNLEDPTSKMLQVILAGQPELEDLLLRPDLRQLRQRIAVHARLEPLTLEEAGAYINSRIREVGCTNKRLFSRAALEAIWSSSQGSPRTINVLCDHALVNAFAMGLDQVDMLSAQEAIQDVLFLRPRLREARRPGPYVIANLDEHRQALEDSQPAPPAGQEGESR